MIIILVIEIHYLKIKYRNNPNLTPLYMFKVYNAQFNNKIKKINKWNNSLIYNKI